MTDRNQLWEENSSSSSSVEYKGMPFGSFVAMWSGAPLPNREVLVSSRVRVVDAGIVEHFFQELGVRDVELEIHRAIIGPFSGKETKTVASKETEGEGDCWFRGFVLIVLPVKRRDGAKPRTPPHPDKTNWTKFLYTWEIRSAKTKTYRNF